MSAQGSGPKPGVDVDSTVVSPPPVHVPHPSQAPNVEAPAPQPAAPVVNAGQYAPPVNAAAPAPDPRGPFAVAPPGYGAQAKPGAQQGAKPVSPFAVAPPGYPSAAAARAGSRPSISDDDATIEPPTRKQSAPDVHEHKQLSTFGELKLILKEFVKKNEKVIWWLHTAYALSLGAFVATFASKGFERARMLTLSLGAAWLLVVFFFRFFGTGAKQDFMTAWPGMRRRFFVMTYLMKNLFQGMLFYLLPFYWKSASIEAKTYTIAIVLSACAVLSTLDLVFDRVLLRFKTASSLFFALTLFGCANIVVPALLPNTPVIVTLCVATGLSIATFILFHVSFATLKKPIPAAIFSGLIVVGVVAMYAGRRALPPVPLTVKDAGVGPSLRDDGSLSMEIRTLRLGQVGDLYAVTDIQTIGHGEHFKHVWRHNKRTLTHEPAEAAPAKDKNVVRVASKLPLDALPSDAEGKYTVDVITDSEQVVGRVVFEIKP